MAELSQLTFIASEAIVVMGLWVLAKITNGQTRLQMTPGNSRTWKPLYEVREASWKRKRQGIVLLSTGELKWKNKSVPEFMDGAQRVQSKAVRFSGRTCSSPKCYIRSGEVTGREDKSWCFNNPISKRMQMQMRRCYILLWTFVVENDNVFMWIMYFIGLCVVFASMSAITVKNRKQGQKFETCMHKQTICDTFWDKRGNGNVTCTGF